MSNTALIVIDIQNDYFPGGTMLLHNAEEAAKNAAQLIARSRSKGLPVYFVQHLGSESSSFFKPNTEGLNIHALVQPQNNEQVIQKHYPNAFHETSLLDDLKSANITDLAICGMMTHMCIDATTRAAKDFGFTCTLIGDACATKDLVLNNQTVPAESVHRSFLAALNGYYATVVDTRQYLEA